MKTPIKVPDFRECPLALKGGRFSVRIVEVPGRNGNTLTREVVVYPGSVVILAMPDPDHIVMIKNKRFAIGQTIWELPAGTLEPGEDPATTAARELEEETGYHADEIAEIGIYFTSPGFCNELMHSYIAKNLTFIGQSLDENEHITVEIVSVSDALEMIKSKTIIDAKSIASILYYTTFLRT